MAKNKVLQKISAGIKRRGTEGAFRHMAEEHGMSTAAMASEVHRHPEKYDTKTQRRANLARVFQQYRPH